MREAFVDICGVPTHILTWGHWIEESFSQREIVICITGNPGLPGYYTRFMATISETIGVNTPVWVIGHTGHDEPPKTSFHKIPPLKGNESKYGLLAQVRHKAEFIKRYVPTGVKVHLIGHSIGAWMILELLKDPEIKEKIERGYLLFPTIERMAISPNGRWFTKLVQPMWFLLHFLSYLLSKFPIIVHVLFIQMFFLVSSIPRYFIGTTLKYIRPTILSKVVYLGGEEMSMVRDCDYELVRQNKDILKFYYGATDGWTPTKYYQELKEKIPDIDAEIDIYQYDHAFVLRSSIEMGKLVGAWILQYKVH